MSWWTKTRDDIEHAVAAPFEAVGGAISDIVQGKNVIDSLISRTQQGVAGVVGAPTVLFSDIPGVKTGLNALSPVTFGLTGDLAKDADYYANAATGTANFSDLTKYGIRTGKDAAVVGAAVYTGGTLGGASTLGQVGAGFAGGSVTSKLLSGDIVGAIQQGASLGVPGADLPSGLVDTYNQAKNLYNEYGPQSGTAQITDSGQGAQMPGVVRANPQAGPVSAVVPVLGVLAYLYFKRKG